MARIRTIKPEFPHSESMGLISRDARLAFILMWTIADDSGRLRGNSRMLASLLFPYDEDAGKKMDHWVDELQKQNCIVRYKADNSEYIQIQKWLIHQRIDKPSPSKIPEFQEDSESTPRLFQEASDSPPVRKGRERKGSGRGKEEEGNVSGIGSGSGKEYTHDFLIFWDLYPNRRGSKQDAFEIYIKAIKQGVSHEKIQSGARGYAAYTRAEGTEPRLIAHATTWLNQGRWESDYTIPQPVAARGKAYDGAVAIARGIQSLNDPNDLIGRLGRKG